MYERLPEPAADEILQLGSAFREDLRSEKVDLGIGVYRDERGNAPVMQAIKAAELSLLTDEQSKSYLGLAGDERFNTAILELVLGDGAPYERTRAIQTPGGGGGVRLLAELIRAASPGAVVWLSNPTWINHRPIMDFVGLRVQTYDYLDLDSQTVAFDRMMGQLAAAAPGDVVLLQGCCHNPSGASLTLAQWSDIVNLANKDGFVPFIDMAYQGFGEGLAADAQATRFVASQVPELLLSVSCSKNFGVYRDRVGCAALVARTSSQANLAKATLASLARVNYTFPPNHGAAAVRTVLEAPQLKASWQEELERMRQRILQNRVALADGLRSKMDSDRFDFIGKHRGMFSLLGITPSQVQDLRAKHAIFMPRDGRINLAGLRTTDVERVSCALHAIAAGNGS
jgi:aspartate/tyrosine/aromatic aminotransferase